MTSRWVYQYISPAASTKTSHRSPRMGWGGQSPPSLEYEIWQRWESSGWWGGVSSINHDNFIVITHALLSSKTVNLLYISQPKCQFSRPEDGQLLLKKCMVNSYKNFETTIIIPTFAQIWHNGRLLKNLLCLRSILANFWFDSFSGYWG